MIGSRDNKLIFEAFEQAKGMKLRISPPLTDEKIRATIKAQIITKWNNSRAKFQPGDLVKIQLERRGQVFNSDHGAYQTGNTIDQELKSFHNSPQLKGEVGVIVAASSPDNVSMRGQNGAVNRGPMFGYIRRDFTRYYVYYPKFGAVQGIHSHILDKVNDPELQQKLCAETFGSSKQENEETNDWTPKHEQKLAQTHVPKIPKGTDWTDKHERVLAQSSPTALATWPTLEAFKAKLKESLEKDTFSFKTGESGELEVGNSQGGLEFSISLEEALKNVDNIKDWESVEGWYTEWQWDSVHSFVEFVDVIMKS